MVIVPVVWPAGIVSVLEAAWKSLPAVAVTSAVAD